MTDRERSHQDRLALAQRVLATAEASTGLHQRLPRAAARRRAAPGVCEREEPRPEEVLPLPTGLGDLVPGGLRRGTAIQVMGSRALLLSLAAAASTAPGSELWCAVVAMPDIGLAAAAEAGLCLDRTIVIPRPGPDAASVLGAVIDGVDLVLLGPCPALSPSDRRSLGHRLRHREAVLLVAEAWPAASAVLEVGARSWYGVGSGEGVLAGREITVMSRARGMGQPRQLRVRMGAGRTLEQIAAPEVDLARAG